ncbi:MAG: TIGR02147 family protein [Bdellovibrionota bacterium]|nr:TIGR02147 family protein [Bdellovibrionota bacterium]
MKSSVYEYLCYREYLQDFYQFKKREKSSYSYKSFSLKAGLASPSHLRLVIKGERSLSVKSLGKFCKGLDLKASEKKYFEHLVWYSQIKDQKNKEDHLKAILRLKKLHLGLKIDTKSETRYYEAWYIPIVFEALKIQRYAKSPHEISKTFDLSLKEVQHAIKTLLEINFVEWGSRGLISKNSYFSSKDEVVDLQIRQFNNKMWAMAGKQFHKPPEERDLRSLTLSVDSSRMPEMKERIRNFIRDFNEEFTNEDRADELMQLNLQLFYLSKQ